MYGSRMNTWRCSLTQKPHQFDPQTHQCACGRWERGFTPKKAPVKPRAECQVCERQQATDASRMVHHGYRRPGWGSIVGDCFGVGHLPFPATDALEQWRGAVEQRLAHLRKSLADLPTVATVTYWKRDYNAPKGTPDKAITIARGAKADYTLGLPSFDDQVRNLTHMFTSEIDQATRELARVTTRIAKGKALRGAQ